MTQGDREMLAFEDTTYGSFSATFVVPNAGFRWAKADEVVAESKQGIGGRAPRGPWLVACDPIEGQPWGRRVSPFTFAKKKGDQETLLRRFLGLDGPDDYQRFANTYGFLGHPYLHAWAGSGADVRADPLSLWQEHTTRVRIFYRLLNWVIRKDTERLKAAIIWGRDPDRVIVRPGGVLDLMAAEQAGETYVPVKEGETRVTLVEGPDGRTRIPEGLPCSWRMPWHRIPDSALYDSRGKPRWQFGDVIGPARFYVFEELNKETRKHIHPKVLPFVRNEESVRVYLVPDCLLSTIYLQLQLLLSDGRVTHESKPCARDGCMNFFRPNRNQRFCSPPCQRWGKGQRHARWQQGNRRKASTPISTPKLADNDGRQRTA